MSEERLGKLRAKLKEITEYIETADQRKTDAKHAIVEASARLEKAETEVQSSRRRICLIEEDLKVTSERLQTAEEKLKTSTDTADECETTRQELETKESEDDEKIQNLEEKIKEMKRTLELNELKCVESQRKQTVYTRDIERIREKADGFETRVKLLEETIANHGQSLQELETREGEAGDREQLNEEKLHFLEGQLKETEVRAEAAERGCAVAERNILETENEINSWIQKREEIEREMIEMDDVADDPAYVMAGATGGSGYQSDSGRVTPSSLKNKLEMFSKKKQDDEESVSSRASSRAANKSQVSAPPSESEEEAPKSEPEPEKEEEEDFWGSKSNSGANSAANSAAPSAAASAAASAANSAAPSEKGGTTTEEETEEGSEEESEEEDDWFK